jgi:acetyl-CoA decarbonylase/synthase, CODH/ACS complex subunit beta
MVNAKQNINESAIAKVLELLPDSVGGFPSQDYPLPVKTAIHGDGDISIDEIKNRLQLYREEDIKKLVDPILIASEIIEAVNPDSENLFITDKEVQGHVFMGSKWLAGWVLVLGAQDQGELVKKLLEFDFLVFTDTDGLEDTVFIGNKSTSPIYFLQMMVRYGLIWGRIAPGDDHEMGHFLEADMPGFMVITEDLDPLKYAVALGIMKLGCPAIVPPSFPFPYGNRIVASGVEDIMLHGTGFPNLRQRFLNNEVIKLPEFCNPAFERELLDNYKEYGNTENSFFCLRPLKKRASRELEIIGTLDKSISIIVDVRHKMLSDDISLTLEKTAFKAIKSIEGVQLGVRGNKVFFQISDDFQFEEKKIYDAVFNTLRLKYPGLTDIYIKIIYDDAYLNTIRDEIIDFKNKRKQTIAGMTEENTRYLCACTECRPFSLEHTCIVTPDRLPMCASRTYFTIKAQAFLGSDTIPYKRNKDKKLPLRTVFKKGRVIDPLKGEYAGSNKIYKILSNQSLNRVQLHSLREAPHTSCGCFQALAFYLHDLEAIGIMIRDSKAVTPEGKTWEQLANSAGGKQTPGIMGVSLQYIMSGSFLKGDGGFRNVVWLDSALYQKMSGKISAEQKIATEDDVSTISELKEFLELQK